MKCSSNALIVCVCVDCGLWIVHCSLVYIFYTHHHKSFKMQPLNNCLNIECYILNRWNGRNGVTQLYSGIENSDEPCASASALIDMTEQRTFICLIVTLFSLLRNTKGWSFFCPNLFFCHSKTQFFFNCWIKYYIKVHKHKDSLGYLTSFRF